MNTRKLFSMLTPSVFAALAIFIAAETASAQGRYANRYSKRDVSAIITRLETSSDAFRRDFDREMNRSNRNDNTQDRFNNIVEDFENSVDQLRRDFDRNDNWWESRNNVQSMIRDANPVNSMMNTLPFRRNIERQWNSLRNDINTVADTYDLPGLNGGGWSGGGGNSGPWNPGGGGGQGIAPPSWAQGTFYGRAPNGQQITLTIGSNGNVNVDVNGEVSYGSFTRGNQLFVNGARSRVTRQGNNGILTVGINTGERISYTRSGWGGGGGNSGPWNPGGGSGDAVRPPNWAQGTFYANANRSRVTLTISGNGQVTVNVDGQLSYGTFTRNNILVVDGAQSRVTSVSGGIRTTGINTGEVITYRRQ